jgi:AAA15 family ATPase/GTPase
MITAIKIKNFKVLQDTDWIPVKGNVVFIGPNNSGKTTGLQALALWNYGLQKWIDKRKTSKAEIRTAAVINRKDLFAIPVSNSKHIWTNLFTHISERDESGKIKGTKYNNIEITVKGFGNNKEWICGLEFRYDSEETIYVKPLQGLDNNVADIDLDYFKSLNIAFLPPMSGLKMEEEKLLFSTVEYRMGEGRTAEVLGNLCFQVINPETEIQKKNRIPKDDWKFLKEKMKKLFLVELLEPELDNKGLLKLKYVDTKGNELEISSAGRGMQQILLLMAYILIKPNCLILLDEPDAHLEIMKQEQVYELISEMARIKESQLLIASHSEVVLRKAVNVNDNVLAFYPHSKKPKFINDEGEQLKKSLKTIGVEDYYLADQMGWVLYLEGATDLLIIRKFAEKLIHPVLAYLENCFYKTINSNDPADARKHFKGLTDAKPDLVGIAIYDHIDNPLNVLIGLSEAIWEKHEIKNYIFSQNVLLAWAKGEVSQDLFGPAESQQREDAMLHALDDILPGAAKRDKKDNYWSDVKASKEIEKILRTFYKYLHQPGDTSKGKFFELVNFIEVDEIDNEVIEKLDFIFNRIPFKTHEKE